MRLSNGWNDSNWAARSPDNRLHVVLAPTIGGAVDVRVPGPRRDEEVPAAAEKCRVGHRDGSQVDTLRDGALLRRQIQRDPVLDLRVVAPLEPVAPVLRDAADRGAGDLLQQLFEALGGVNLRVQAAQRVLAVGVGDVPAQVLPQFVYREGSVVPPKIADPGDLPFEHQIAEDHLSLSVPLGRPIFGEPFGEPERRHDVVRLVVLLVDLFHHRQLEDVHELVVDDVPEFAEGACVGEYDPSLRELGEALHALGEIEGADVRLFEVLMRGVDDHRDRADYLVLKLGLEVLVTLLGQRQGGAGDRLFFGIIEYLHVLAAEREPLEVVVLYFVLSERVALGVRGNRGRDARQGRD